MSEDAVSRRDFAARLAAATGGIWLSRSLGGVSWRRDPLDARSANVGWRVLTRSERANVEAVASCIMPSDDSAGAREAGVVRFVDVALATWARDKRVVIRDGLAELDTRCKARWGRGPFAELADGEQEALLHEAEETAFFQTMRLFTAFGMFGDPRYGGNAGEAGWRLIGFEDRHRWQQPFGYYDGAASEGEE